MTTGIVALLGLWMAVQQPVRPSPQSVPEVSTRSTPAAPQVYFSPHGGCTKAVVDYIGGSRHDVRMLAYSFTSKPILAALNDATTRGIDVQAILDSSQAGLTSASAQLTCPHSFDHMHAIAHNKVIIIDGSIVLTGSFNFTGAAEASNAENLLVIHNQPLAAKYLDNWTLHRAHSQEAKP